ncbi:hypothetical protein PVAP13_7NG006991 [Panicum virgatum]|uniref:Uncharacterized protein n=1 Tax=Panicum virgatum TaxID=38727 RepID=A0A8T0PVB5_PANVG|nr:hypothetical protein PVAP13_7NG006991 [Panicum virgatum]
MHITDSQEKKPSRHRRAPAPAVERAAAEGSASVRLPRARRGAHRRRPSHLRAVAGECLRQAPMRLQGRPLLRRALARPYPTAPSQGSVSAGLPRVRRGAYRRRPPAAAPPRRRRGVAPPCRRRGGHSSTGLLGPRRGARRRRPPPGSHATSEPPCPSRAALNLDLLCAPA